MRRERAIHGTARPSSVRPGVWYPWQPWDRASRGQTRRTRLRTSVSLSHSFASPSLSHFPSPPLLPRPGLFTRMKFNKSWREIISSDEGFPKSKSAHFQLLCCPCFWLALHIAVGSPKITRTWDGEQQATKILE